MAAQCRHFLFLTGLLGRRSQVGGAARLPEQAVKQRPLAGVGQGCIGGGSVRRLDHLVLGKAAGVEPRLQMLVRASHPGGPRRRDGVRRAAPAGDLQVGRIAGRLLQRLAGVDLGRGCWKHAVLVFAVVVDGHGVLAPVLDSYRNARGFAGLG